MLAYLKVLSVVNFSSFQKICPLHSGLGWYRLWRRIDKSGKRRAAIGQAHRFELLLQHKPDGLPDRGAESEDQPGFHGCQLWHGGIASARRDAQQALLSAKGTVGISARKSDKHILHYPPYCFVHIAHILKTSALMTHCALPIFCPFFLESMCIP